MKFHAICSNSRLIKPFVLGLVLQVFSMSASGAENKTVDIQKFKFIPQEVTVNVGDTVRWTNKEKRQYHSVWFEALGEPEPDYFFPGESYQRRFDKAGSYPYRCGPHPKMIGIVHVK